ncbi:aspartic and glutamic acid-rich protein isoform X4 [Fagus crenata]
MGGCATKPKVLKEESAPEPEPAKEEKAVETPELTKEEEPGVKALDNIDIVKEEKEKVVVEGEGDKAKEIVDDDVKAKEIVDDDKVDEQGSKRRSLSLLFKQNEEVKDSTGDGNPAVEPLKQEEPSVNIKPADESETKLSEVEKYEIPVEKAPVPEVVDAQNPITPVEVTLAPVVVDTQKDEIPVELTPATVFVDAQESLTPVQKTSVSEPVNALEKAETEKTIESAPTEAPKVADETKKAIEPAPAVKTQTDGTEEKKTEAPGVVANAYEKAETLKPIEAAVGTKESQKVDTSEEKKTEAKESAEEKVKV